MIHSLTLSDALAEHARSRPQVTAVVDGEVRLTYPELDERVSRLAAALDGLGVGAGDRVVWLGQNAYAVLELLLACSRLGAVLCPANWRQSLDELRFVLGDLAPGAVVWEPSDVTTALRDEAGGAWVRAGEEYERLLAGAAPRDFAQVSDAEPVLALYTAAFSGRPSAALLSSAALLAHATTLLVVRRMEPGFTFLNNGPLFHVGTMMFCLATFQIGGTNVFTPAFDPEEVCRLIDAERVTQAFLFGPMIDAVAKANAGGKYDLSSLRFVAHSAEWNDMITVDDSPWCRSKMGGYGQTEVGGMLTFLGLAEGGAGPAGRPSPLAQVRIMAPDGSEVPVGEVGEICARGKTLFSGYFARPDLNAEKVAVRLAPHRRPRPPRTRRHHHLHRPQATHDQVGRREHLPRRGRTRAQDPPRRGRRRRHRRPRPRMAPDGQGRRVPEAGRHRHGGRPDHAREGPAGGVQAPAPRHVRGHDPETRLHPPDYDALDEAHGGGNYPGA
ncbi:hypothetical protein GCM10020001_069780 [Nonomuraea salmonea]